MMKKLLTLLLIVVLLGTGLTLGLVFKNNGTYKVVKTTSTILGIETIHEVKDYDDFNAAHKAIFDRQVVIDRKFITIKSNKDDEATIYKYSRDGEKIVFEQGDIKFNDYTYKKGRIYETFELLGQTYVVEYKR